MLHTIRYECPLCDGPVEVPARDVTVVNDTDTMRVEATCPAGHWRSVAIPERMTHDVLSLVEADIADAEIEDAQVAEFARQLTTVAGALGFSFRVLKAWEKHGRPKAGGLS